MNSGFRAVLVTTGGGSSALNALLTTPGASRFVIEAHVPYSPEALERFLGENPEHAVSPATAQKLAQTAVRGQDSGVIGFSCSAALMTDRQRRGEDRAFVCIKTAAAEKVFALYLSKTSREEQEKLLSNWLLTLIAQATGAERGLMLP
ncbi:MAG: CinA family protein, partial [Kiritimatiellales bacterium]